MQCVCVCVCVCVFFLFPFDLYAYVCSFLGNLECVGRWMAMQRGPTFKK